MSTSIPTAFDKGDKQERPYRPFSVAEYHKLAEFGILSGDDRVELLDGVISTKMIHSPIHDAVVSHAEQQLRPHLLSGWFFRIQSSIAVNDKSEPEPDLAIVRGTPLTYLQRHPGGEDVGLVIEVAETSTARDRFKAAGYGSAGIPAYWIINLQLRQIECYSDPQEAGYRELKILGLDDPLDLGVGFDTTAKLKVSDLIPQFHSSSSSP